MRHHFVGKEESQRVMGEIAKLINIDTEYVDEDGFTIEIDDEKELVRVSWYSYAHFNRAEFNSWIARLYAQVEAEEE